MIAQKAKILLLSMLAIGLLAVPVTSVHAKKDPFVSAIHTGGTGGGDGDVIFEIVNSNDNNGVVTITVTETDTNQNQIRQINATPLNWQNNGIVFKNGKAVTTSWQTCIPGGPCAPVTSGNSLNGFDVKMVGQAPYGWNWLLSDTAGANFSGSLSVS
jgi:hypothetical protein